MIDKGRLEKILIRYLNDFPRRWNEDKECCKWEAVQHFQKTWNVEAIDFADMLIKALSPALDLLSIFKNYPTGVIFESAKKEPEMMRGMFVALYDEERAVFDRIKEFKESTEVILDKHSIVSYRSTQTQNAILSAITTYLWLRYPDNYYTFRLNEVKCVSTELRSPYRFSKDANIGNIQNFLNLYDEINHELLDRPEVIKALRNHLTAQCYYDPALHILTNDFGLYISRFIAKDYLVELPSENWWPSIEEYTPGLTKENWLEILNRPEIVGKTYGEILAGFYMAGGEATCSKIAEDNNESPNSISGHCTNLARRIYKRTKCHLLREEGKKCFWPILFQGKNVENGLTSELVWRLRPELYDALTDFDIVGKYGRQMSLEESDRVQKADIDDSPVKSH